MHNAKLFFLVIIFCWGVSVCALVSTASRARHRKGTTTTCALERWGNYKAMNCGIKLHSLSSYLRFESPAALKTDINSHNSYLISAAIPQLVDICRVVV
jgi:hypothetical protein